MVRNVMFTPWFAVSAGIVVAASLTLAAPHAALTFPPDMGGRCAAADCPGGGTGSSGGPQPAIRREVKLHVSEKRYIRAQPSPISVDYQFLPRRPGQFMAVIVLAGRKVLGRWTLRLALPGAHVDSVMWARWQPDGADGIVVHGSPLPWPRSDTNEARIVVLGTGVPGDPRGCVIDNARCTFRPLVGPSNPRPAGDSRGYPRHDRWHHRGRGLAGA